jgi:hypothetical protein
VTVAEPLGPAGPHADHEWKEVPPCVYEAKERFNAEKWKRPVNVSKFVEYRAPWNSVIKMAQKRAMVGGVLIAMVVFQPGLTQSEKDTLNATTDILERLGA